MGDSIFREEVLQKLDVIIRLIEIQQHVEIEKIKKQVFGKSDSMREIYDLCDGKRTITEISKLLNIRQPNVSMYVSKLQSGGLIKCRKIGRSVVCSKIL